MEQLEADIYGILFNVQYSIHDTFIKIKYNNSNQGKFNYLKYLARDII